MRDFSEPLRECALLTINVRDNLGQSETVHCEAVVNDWAVHLSLTPAERERNRYSVTHVPSGLKLGRDMSKRDALRTLAKLRDVRVRRVRNRPHWPADWTLTLHNSQGAIPCDALPVSPVSTHKWPWEE